ncbi:amino acid ABC transporter permease [Psychrobacillus sp. NEAU-3TGS]|uniref:amino acid ABC transporter permease n=1 Tax=Psychrobacillus sp. NEAU-3TGS TaxID=2995412 RepID=UPI0024963F9D|nr:amino acid ABC transporter permease [Psychrobacillus sp. NEAU-3TGS]MDI2588804.1 amino acid ABC transporter permease [Psychrobacillus sp. NEAU-3TGS]
MTLETGMQELLMEFLKTLPINIIIIILSAALGLLFAVLLTFVRLKRIPVISQLADLYVSFARSVPGLILLFIAYFGIPKVLPLIGLGTYDISPMHAAIISMGFYHSGYISEVFRPAYLAVEKSQHEAADSLGYTPMQKFFRIILPQMVPVALPGYGNALVYLIHDTSLIFAIGIVDIMGTAELSIARSYGTNQILIYFIIALMFSAMCFTTDGLVRKLEKRVAIR